MKTVYKYPLQITSYQKVGMHQHAQVLHVGAQGNQLFLWALIEDQLPGQERHIRIYGTGHEIDQSMVLNHLGTVQMPDGCVWHVFEEYRK